MKSLFTFVAGFTFCAAALTGGHVERSQTILEPCLYYAETPTGTEAYYGLEDAQEALRHLGVDLANTPVGYDITSRAGC